MVGLRKRDQLEVLDRMYREIAADIKPVWKSYPWPLIRILVGYHFHLFQNAAKSEHQRKPEPSGITRYSLSLKRVFRLYFHYVRVFALSKKMKGALHNKVLLVGYADHINVADGKNIYIHPCKEELDNLGIQSEVLFIQMKGTLDKPGSLNNLYNACYAFQKARFEFQNALNNSQNKTAFNNAQLVGNWIDFNGLNYGTQIKELIYSQLGGHQIKFAAFKQFLSITQPKLIWTYCFYDGTIMALVRAANTLNISLVEYQHSAQYDDHFAYAKWDDVDRFSEYFPSRFWLWRQSDEERIIKNFAGQMYRPLTLAGGNIFLAQQRKFFTRINGNQKGVNVLVCLQGQWIPTFMEKFIQEQEGYTWYFRLHPRYPQDKEQLLQLQKVCGVKVETNDANQLSLYDLFRRVEFNITAYSGTALEAHSFGVKNIIFGEEGHATFAEYIRNNSFAFVRNEEELSNALKDSGVFRSEAYDPVLTDLEKIGQYLKSLLYELTGEKGN